MKGTLDTVEESKPLPWDFRGQEVGFLFLFWFWFFKSKTECFALASVGFNFRKFQKDLKNPLSLFPPTKKQQHTIHKSCKQLRESWKRQ